MQGLQTLKKKLELEKIEIGIGKKIGKVHFTRGREA
jgi:hypothetical protein